MSEIAYCVAYFNDNDATATHMLRQTLPQRMDVPLLVATLGLQYQQ